MTAERPAAEALLARLEKLAQRLSASAEEGEWEQARLLDAELSAAARAVSEALAREVVERGAAARVLERVRGMHAGAMATLARARDTIAVELGDAHHARRGITAYLDSMAG